MSDRNVYIHKIAAIDISKIYFLKNAKKTCKLNTTAIYIAIEWILITVEEIIINIIQKTSRNFEVYIILFRCKTCILKRTQGI